MNPDQYCKMPQSVDVSTPMKSSIFPTSLTDDSKLNSVAGAGADEDKLSVSEDVE